MSGEKTFWRLPAPFRRTSTERNPPLEMRATRSRGRVSSVYLSDDSSTSGFIIVPEFDDPMRTKTTAEGSNHTSRLLYLSGVTSPDSFSSDSVDDYFCDLESIGSQYSSHTGGGSSDISVDRDDDLAQRLSSAYEHIRTMSCATSPEVFLSSNPYMLRRQLGVPQHSVLNHPTCSSLDLPNPHPSSCQSTSSTLLSTTLSGMSRPRTLKKPGVRLNSEAYPLSPRHCFADYFQSTQRKSMVTAPTLSENPLSDRRTLEEPQDARISRTSQPQSSISNTSKHTKRRVEKFIVSPSSLLSSSRRQALKGVLRKPAADTSPSDNAYRWQTSLPQVRSLSPFTIDIPLHHAWHDRQTDFNSREYYSKGVHICDKKSRLGSGSADILGSLAWIGAPPIESSPCPANQGCQPASTAFFSDQLSMTIAMEDDGISDDVLADQLEKVRKTGDPSQWSRHIPPSRSPDDAHPRSVGENVNEYLHVSCPSPPLQNPHQLVGVCDVPLPSAVVSKNTTSESDDTTVWQAARKAILCVREIIRTEKKYQEALKMLLNAQTVTPPPPSMAPYVSALVRASEMLLKCFLEDPSAWGVSTAFVTSEDELELTMVSWCAVAGVFFTDESDRRPSGSTGKRRFKSGTTSNSSPSVRKHASSPPQLPPMSSMTSTTSRTKERIDEEYRARQQPWTEQENNTTSEPPQNSESINKRTLSSQPPSWKLSVRDLAIRPIQRVMRYVLLYKDLLHCTPPTSPSYLLVERALEAATRIANHCDRAQRNPAFCHVS